MKDHIADAAVPSEAEYFAFPLTPAQSAMLPSRLDEITDARYNGSFRMALTGKVDAALIERAFRLMTQRHEALRAIFIERDGQVEQVVLPESNATLVKTDLRRLPDAKRGEEADAICLREAQAGFDLRSSPPVRIGLLQLQEQSSILTVTIHQIVCDGWSIGIIMEELAALYSALAKGELPSLAPLAFQFGDYVIWQRDNESQAEHQSQLEYWTRKLEQFPGASVAPDFAPASVSAKSDIVSVLLPRTLSDELYRCAREQQTTFFVLTLSACMVLLSKYANSTDLALRTPLANRGRVEFEDIIGQFTNQVILRSGVPGSLSFTELLSRVREDLWEALANQRVPFQTVMDHVLPSGASADTIFPINFICQREYGRNSPFQFDLNGATMKTLPSKSQGALFDLNFFLVEREAGWRLSVEYKTDLYRKETAESLLGHFQEVLWHIARNPGLKLDEVVLSDTLALNERIKPNAQPSMTNVSEFDPDLSPAAAQALPASFAQERFWTLLQMDPTNPVFNIPAAVEVKGPLSIPRLEKSFQVLIERHETLRTSFSEIDGKLMQVVHPDAPFTLHQVSVEHFPESQRPAQLKQVMTEEIEKPFNLSLQPLFRVLVCRVAQDNHILLITIHHSLSDAWSVKVLQREIWEAYNCLRDHDNFRFPPLAIQYADFSVWQREQASSESMQQQLDYWLQTLSGNLPTLNFPTDHPPAYPQQSRGGIETLLLPEALSQSLKQFAQASDTTLFVLTLSCYAMVLSRASEATDLIIGSPTVNRRIETEPLIGPFAGPVALRFAITPEMTVSDLVSAAKQITFGALDNADLPFELILERLRLRSVAGRNPLFQFYFFCQPAFLQSHTDSELTITPVPSMSLATPFEMQLAVVERTEGIRVEIEYNATLFDRSTILEWLDYYQTILTETVSHPDSVLSDLPAPPRSASTATSTGLSIDASADRDDSGVHVEPSDAIEVALAQLWQRMLKLPSVSVNSTFFSLGGHSLMMMSLLKEVNKVFGTNLEVTALFQAPTIEKLARVIRGVSNHAEWSSLVPLNPNGTKKPFFLVHSYMLYGRLPAALGEDQPFYGLKQPPLSRYTTPEWVDHMLQDHIKHIRLVQPTGPYQIAGWCFAGLMAYEIARRLEESGSEVSVLLLLDSWCPYKPQESAAHKPSQEVAPESIETSEPPERASQSHLISALHTGRFHWDRMMYTPRGGRLKYAHMILRELFWNFYNRRTREVKGMIYRFFCRYRIPQPGPLRDITVVTYEWIRNYKPKPYRGDIILVRSEGVPVPSEADPTCGWGRMTTGEVRSIFAPGDRRTMFLAPHLSVLADKIRALLS